MEPAPVRFVMLLAPIVVGLGTLAILVAGATWIFRSVAAGWSKARQAKYQHDLKILMIQRGMSADEIERVLAAGTGEQVKFPLHDETSPPAKPQAGPMKWPVHSDN